MTQTVQSLFKFLEGSPSAFHAIGNITNALEARGYVRLRECEPWQILPGGRYYLTRNLSSLVAFQVPDCGAAPVRVVASHSDSPTFRVKPRAELHVQGKYTLLNTERYGGMILSSWLDRPLSIAGRVLLRQEGRLFPRLLCADRDLVLIPSLAIHMNRDVNDSNKLNAQVDMMPVFGDGTAAGTFEDAVAELAGCDRDSVVSSDLYLYNRQAPVQWGRNGEYISAPRLDDLECAFASLEAFLSAECKRHINVLCVFDNEEVGSGTRQGADSTLLSDVLTRAFDALGADTQALHAAIAGGFLVSADNSHAMHPNHPEKADAENRPFMNEGIVIKFSANQKYCSDGLSSALFASLMKDAGVPVQYFSNRSDSVGGSTLGNISIAHVSLPSVDIGLAQLAMHSSYETAGARDVDYMIDGLRAYYSADTTATDDGAYSL